MPWRSCLALITLAGCDLAFSLDRSTCAGEDCLTDLATDEVQAAELVLDGADMFWTIDGTNGSIRGCSLAACQPRTVSAIESSPHSLIVNGGNLFWATEQSVRWVARTATAQPSTPLTNENFPIVSTRFVQAKLFSGLPDRLVRCDYESQAVSCTNSTTLPNPLGSIAGPLATDSMSRLWGASPQRLYFVDDGSRFDPKSFAVSDVNAIVANTDAVFVLDGSGKVSAWSSTDPGDTAATLIAAEPIRTFGVDETDVYLADTAGNLLRVSATELGATPTIIAADLPPIRSLAIGPDRVFVLTEDRIASISKPVD